MNGTCVGVVCVGRPVARMTDCRRILEVTRLCSDGTKNVCSALYAAASRVGKEMGYEKIQTFILASEPGTSLKATGWVRSHDSAGGVWGRPSRGRRVTAPTDPKVCWTRDLNPSDRISDYL
jgi:hypothetical protein